MDEWRCLARGNRQYPRIRTNNHRSLPQGRARQQPPWVSQVGATHLPLYLRSIWVSKNEDLAGSAVSPDYVGP